MTEAEEIKQLKATAKLHFDAIKEASVMVSTSSMLIGYHAYRLKNEALFGALGFATEDEVREAAGVGTSTWYANIRLAEQFKDLSEKKFVAMRQCNAKALADMPESKRYDPQWVKDASHKSGKEFMAMVDKEMNGKAKASDGEERSTTMKLGMPASRKVVIEEKAKVFAEARGIEPHDLGKVFEVMCIETADVGTQFGLVITQGLKRIAAARELIRSNLSADEVLIKINEILDEMEMDFQHVLEQNEDEDQ
jgi:hypothetical protein